MEGITVDTCSLDGSRQTSYIQLLSLANSDLLSTAASSGSKPTIRIQPVVQKKTFAIPSNSNSDFSRLNLTDATETLLCAYDNQQKTLTVLGSTNFGRNLFTLSRSDDAGATIAENPTKDIKIPSSKKSKGGWPKGRRRRKVHPNAKTPKQPSTAYNLFCNQRRSVVKLENPDLALSEIMKILGKEWNVLSKIDKQKFVEMADADMERYKKELNAYKNSLKYQEYLKSEKLSIDFDKFDNGEISTIVDQQTIDLHCKDCDIYFHNIHNKIEHVRGKSHRMNTIKKFEDFWTKKSKLQRSSCCKNSTKQIKQPLIMEDLLINFFERNREQEMELDELRICVGNYKEKNESVRNLVNLYEVRFLDKFLLENSRKFKTNFQSNLNRMRDEMKSAINEKNKLQQKLSKLNLVKMLFQTDAEMLSV